MTAPAPSRVTRVLVLGANGQIARVATGLFLQRTDVRLTLFLRNSHRLRSSVSDEQVSIIEGDVLDVGALTSAMADHDVVYANLDGLLEQQAQAVIAAMQQSGLKRLIWISSMGIYDEVPEEKFGCVLDPYRKSAHLIESSNLDFTVVRPAWLNDRDEIAYGTTRKGEPFENGNLPVSRRSVADLVVRLATTAALELRSSLGVHRSRP